MATILATVTEDARKYWPQFFGTLLGIPNATGSPTDSTHWNPLIKYFRVGEGGWITNTATPRTPQPNLRRLDAVTGYDTTGYLIQDLDSIVDRQRAPVDQRYPALQRGWFEKVLNPSTDFIFASLSTIQIRCLLDFGDFNDTYAVPAGTTSPNICELGLYSDHPLVAAEYPTAKNIADAIGVANPKAAYDATGYADKRLLIAYGTFPAELKDSSKQIEHLVQLVF